MNLSFTSNITTPDLERDTPTSAQFFSSGSSVRRSHSVKALSITSAKHFASFPLWLSLNPKCICSAYYIPSFNQKSDKVLSFKLPAQFEVDNFQFLFNFNPTQLIYSQAQKSSIEELLKVYANIEFQPNVRIGPANNFAGQPLWFSRRKSILTAAVNATPSAVSSNETQPTIIVPPVLKRKRLERLVRKNDPIAKFDWLNISPRMESIRADFSKILNKKFQEGEKISRSSSETTSDSSNKSIRLIPKSNQRNVSSSNILQE